MGEGNSGTEHRCKQDLLGYTEEKESVGAVLNLIKNAIPLEYKIVGNSVFLSSTK